MLPPKARASGAPRHRPFALAYWPLLFVLPLACSCNQVSQVDARHAPRRNEAEKKIEGALSKKIDWKYENVALADVIDDVARQAGLPIELDQRQIGLVGLDPSSPITLDFGPMSLRSGLQILEMRHELTYTARGRGLAIVPLEVGEERLITRVYPVSDLLEVKEEPLEDRIHDHDALIDLLSGVIRPDSWIDAGGYGTATAYNGTLAISHSLPVHHEVEQLLTALRVLKADAKIAPQGVSGPVLSLDDSAALRQALLKQHSDSVDLELKLFVRRLSEVLGYPILLDPKGLEEAGVPDTLIVQTDYRDTPLGDLLRDVLADHDLALVLRGEFALVTSRERAAETFDLVKLYPVYDLVDDDIDSLADLIESTVQPDSWIDWGGMGAIVEIRAPAALAIANTGDIHLEAERLLADVRASGAAKFRRDARAASEQRIVQRIYPLYVARRELQVKMARPPAAEPAKEKEGEAAAATTPQPVAPQFGGMGGMGGMAGMGMEGPALWQPSQVADPVPSSEEVALLIRELLPDESWQEKGVLLRPFHDVLIVRQRPAMLRKVEKLLIEIDAWRAPPFGFSPDRPFINSPMPVVGSGGGFF
jgi:hypothetical protein